MHDELLQQRRRRADQVRRRTRSIVERRPRARRARSTAATIGTRRRRVERQSEGHDLSTWSARSTSIASFVDEAQAVRLNNSSCQVYMALKPGERARRKPGRLAVQLDRAAVPHRAAAEPRRHQPHLFVLLSAHAARQRPLADRLQHERQLRGLGRSVARGVRSQQARPDRNDARRARQVRARHPRASSITSRPRRRCTFEHYTKHVRRGQLRHEVRRPGRQPRPFPQQIGGLVPRRQRRHHHVGLAGRDELRRDRGQRRRHLADEDQHPAADTRG